MLNLVLNLFQDYFSISSGQGSECHRMGFSEIFTHLRNSLNSEHLNYLPRKKAPLFMTGKI